MPPKKLKLPSTLHVTHKCQPKQFLAFYREELVPLLNQNPFVQELFENWVFKKYLDLPEIGMCRKFLAYMFRHYDSVNHGFRFGDALLVPIEEEFSLVLGLRAKGSVVAERKEKWRSADVTSSKLCQKFFPNRGKITRDELAQKLKEQLRPDAIATPKEWMSLFTMYFLSMVLFSVSDATVPMFLWEYVESFDRIMDFAWGPAVFHFTSKNWRKIAASITAKSNVGNSGAPSLRGAHFPLIAWAFEFTKPRCVRRQIGQTPRFKNWHLKLVHEQDTNDVIRSMRPNSNLITGLVPNPDESWIFVGDFQMAREMFFNPHRHVCNVSLMANIAITKALSRIFSLVGSNLSLLQLSQHNNNGFQVGMVSSDEDDDFEAQNCNLFGYEIPSSKVQVDSPAKLPLSVGSQCSPLATPKTGDVTSVFISPGRSRLATSVVSSSVLKVKRCVHNFDSSTQDSMQIEPINSDERTLINVPNFDITPEERRSEHDLAAILNEIQTQNLKMVDFFQKSAGPSTINIARVLVPDVQPAVTKFPSLFQFFDCIFPGKHFPESDCVGWDEPKSNKILAWDILTPNQQKTFQAWFNGRIEPTKTESLAIYQTTVSSNELYLFLNGYPSIDEIVDSFGLLVYATCRRNDCPWLYVSWAQVGIVPQASAEDLWSDLQYKWTYDGTLSKVKYVFLPFVCFGHWVLIQFDFEKECVVVWNTLSSKDQFEKDTLVIIEIWKKWMASVLLRGELFEWNVQWNHTVQQGCSNDCGLFIMKIMECIVTDGNLELIDQAYISRVKVQAVYNILAVQFYRHLLPDVYNLA